MKLGRIGLTESFQFQIPFQCSKNIVSVLSVMDGFSATFSDSLKAVCFHCIDGAGASVFYITFYYHFFFFFCFFLFYLCTTQFLWLSDFPFNSPYFFDSVVFLYYITIAKSIHNTYKLIICLFMSIMTL